MTHRLHAIPNDDGSYNLGYRRWYCECGWTNPDRTESIQSAYRKHLAKALQSEAGILLQEIHDAIDGGSQDDEGTHLDLNIDEDGLDYLLTAICEASACDGYDQPHVID